MDIWNEYEGKIIADSYPLEKLLYPEGRSGFFSTWNGTGTLATIRLTESLNDQSEMLEQWQIVRDLSHPNLIAILKCGETVVDEVPLVYAVLEPADATLADMLAERAMTVEETSQIASSVAAALQALHDKGLVHEHIEPASVRAVGEVVKLRSDCVRKVANEVERKGLISKDVRDFCVVLRQALTRQRGEPHPSSTAQPLPAPFDRIVPNGLRGVWGLEEISKALRGGVSQSPAVTAAPAASTETVPVAIKNPTPVAEKMPPVRRMPEPFEEMPSAAKPRLRGGLPWIALAVLVLLVAVIAWRNLRISAHKSAATVPQQSQPAASASPQAAAPPPNQTPDAVASAPAVAANPAVQSTSAQNPPLAQGRDVWRLVVYTYNRQSEAEGKAASIKRNHADWNPEVFAPNGHAPYLVTLGGSMSHQEASQLLRKARAERMPRDSYVQNYAVR